MLEALQRVERCRVVRFFERAEVRGIDFPDCATTVPTVSLSSLGPTSACTEETVMPHALRIESSYEVLANRVPVGSKYALEQAFSCSYSAICASATISSRVASSGRPLSCVRSHSLPPRVYLSAN